MANYRSKIWLLRWLLQRQRSSTSGFTLIEVLISVIIAGFIVTGLLSLVVELLQIDRREIVLERVQRDMQRAMDYISEDLEEAVYVYNNDKLDEIVGKIGTLNDAVTTDGSVPVLAFWRTVPLDQNKLGECDAATQACQVERTSRVSYSLVVYYQQPRKGPWKGESTLVRYELPKYPDDADFTNANFDLPSDEGGEVSIGYATPINANGETKFEIWEPDPDFTAAAVQGTSEVLVDYVKEAETVDGTTLDCKALIAEFNGPLVGIADATDPRYDVEFDYLLSPKDSTNEAGFFACIREPQLSDEAFRSTQDVYLFLKGSATGPNQVSFLGPSGGENSNSKFPLLQTQVKLRGVIDKDN